MKIILFVCTSNTCRSPIAEALLKQMLHAIKIEDVQVRSRGLAAIQGSPITDGARKALLAMGINANDHRARPLTREDVLAANLILVMETRHLKLLEDLQPDAAGKMFLLTSYTGDESASDIADPIGGSLSDYEKCRIVIQDCLLGLLEKINS